MSVGPYNVTGRFFASDKLPIAIWSNYLSTMRPMMIKSTTRHIHIFSAEVQDNELVPSDSVLTLDVDPDNELVWSDDALQKFTASSTTWWKAIAVLT